MDLEATGGRLQTIVPTGLVIETGSHDADVDLLPDEKQLTEGWAPQRQLQFALGRTLARRALAKLGIGEVPIPFDARGVPIWPPEAVGSISHKRQNCLVAVGRTAQLDGIGVDLELDRIERDEDELRKRVCHTAAELRQCRELRNRCCSPATAFLSAKEAFFKLQYPITRMELDWDEVEIDFGPETEFAVSSRRSKPASRAKGIAVMTPKGWTMTLALLEKPCNCS